jgi:hypothetical protein
LNLSGASRYLYWEAAIPPPQGSAMAVARRILAIVVLAIGITAGAAVGAMWADLNWPAVAADNYNGHHVLRALGLVVFGGLGLWLLVAWPFAWLSERINPAPEGKKE